MHRSSNISTWTLAGTLHGQQEPHYDAFKQQYKHLNCSSNPLLSAGITVDAWNDHSIYFNCSRNPLMSAGTFLVLIKAAMLSNYPSSTHFHLAVSSFNIRVEPWKPDYKGWELSQQYPQQSGSTPLKCKSWVIKNWSQCWGTIPAVPPSIWQYPLSI